MAGCTRAGLCHSHTWRPYTKNELFCHLVHIRNKMQTFTHSVLPVLQYHICFMTLSNAFVSYPNTHIVQFWTIDYWPESSTIILFPCKIGHRCVTHTDMALISPSLINQLSSSPRKSQVISKTVINNKNIRPDHSRDPRKLSKSGKKETWN